MSLLATSALALDQDPLLEALSASWRVQEWPETTLPTRDQIRSQLGDRAYEQLAREHHSYFASRALQRRLRSAIDASLPAFQRLLDFYRKAPGSLLVADRQVALTHAALQNQAAFLASKFASRGPSRRLEVIRRMDEATHLADDILQVARASLGALAEGATRLSCLPPRAGPAERRTAVATLKRMEGPVHGRAQVMLEFAHRERDTLELAREAQAAEGTLRPAFSEFSHVLKELLRAADREFLARIDELAAESCSGGRPST